MHPHEIYVFNVTGAASRGPVVLRLARSVPVAALLRPAAGSEAGAPGQGMPVSAQMKLLSSRRISEQTLRSHDGAAVVPAQSLQVNMQLPLPAIEQPTQSGPRVVPSKRPLGIGHCCRRAVRSMKRWTLKTS